MDRRELEYRRIVLHLADKLSNDDRIKLSYIFSVPECNESLGILGTLKYLETRLIYSQSNPEGLVLIAKMVDREDLVRSLKTKIKDYCYKAVQEETVTTTTYSYGPTLCNPDLQWYFDSALNLTPCVVEHVLTVRSLLFRVACSGHSTSRMDAKAADYHLQAAEERYWEAIWELQTALKIVGCLPRKGSNSWIPQEQGQAMMRDGVVSTEGDLKGQTSSE